MQEALFQSIYEDGKADRSWSKSEQERHEDDTVQKVDARGVVSVAKKFDGDFKNREKPSPSIFRKGLTTAGQ